jgi:hypothetical protein
MKTIIVEQPEGETWRDGTPMICSVCGHPILRSQPRYATNSHSPKKRDAYHYFCAGGTLTLIGSPTTGVMEISQYGGQK